MIDLGGDVAERLVHAELAPTRGRDASGIALRQAHNALRDVHGPIRERDDG